MENGASWFSRNSRGRFTTIWWSLFYNNESLQRRSRDLWRTSHICSLTTWTSRCSCPAASIPRASSLLRSGRTIRRACWATWSRSTWASRASCPGRATHYNPGRRSLSGVLTAAGGTKVFWPLKMENTGDCCCPMWLGITPSLFRSVDNINDVITVSKSTGSVGGLWPGGLWPNLRVA